MKLAGVARFDCVGSTQEFACYMAGLTSPGDHTCGWTISSQPRQRCLGDTGSVGDVAPHQQQASSRIWRVATSPTRVLQAQITQRCTRYVAMHPLRRDAPDQKGCNAYGSGTPPPATSPTAGNSSRHTPTVRFRRCDTASTCSPGSEREALHPLRRKTPVTSRCTRSEGV